MFRQLKGLLSPAPTIPREAVIEARRPRRDRRPRVEGLEQRSLCDAAADTLINTGSPTTGTIVFNG